jgi:hypothetical protein
VQRNASGPLAEHTDTPASSRDRQCCLVSGLYFIFWYHLNNTAPSIPHQAWLPRACSCTGVTFARVAPPLRRTYSWCRCDPALASQHRASTSSCLPGTMEQVGTVRRRGHSRIEDGTFWATDRVVYAHKLHINEHRWCALPNYSDRVCSSDKAVMKLAARARQDSSCNVGHMNEATIKPFLYGTHGPAAAS